MSLQLRVSQLNTEKAVTALWLQSLKAWRQTLFSGHYHQ
jgi:hypothetical protein